MSGDPTVAELLDRLAAARLAELVRENRELRARLAAAAAVPRTATATSARPHRRPHLRVVRGEAAR